METKNTKYEKLYRKTFATDENRKICKRKKKLKTDLPKQIRTTETH